MEDLNFIDWGTFVLVIVGALNWGLEGVGRLMEENLNVVNLLLDQGAGVPEAEALVYILVGLSGLYQIYFGYELYEDKN